jgi:hypothetical protein
MHKNRMTNWWLLFSVISLMLFPGTLRAEIKEKSLLLNSPAFGDFRQAQKLKEPKTVSLKVWPPYLEYADKSGQAARGLAPKGVEALEVADDEVWVAEGQGYQAFGKKQMHNGQPDIAKLYWRDGAVQAYVVERYYTGDPITYQKLESPAYKVVLILDRARLEPEIARLTAQAQAFGKLTPLDHLQAARLALLEGMPNDQDLKKRTYGRLAEARRHLEAIPKKSKEYGEAQKLLQEVARREEDARKYQEMMRQAAAAQGLKKRQELVRDMDRDFLDKGMDVKLAMSGAEKTTLSLECLLFNRPMVYTLVEKTDLIPNLKNAGFKEVIFSNKALSYSWEIDLGNL